jgi:hypothetical protein
MLLYMAGTLPILTGRYGMLNELKLRTLKRNETLPFEKWQPSESWYTYMERIGAQTVKVRGKIGYSGTKTHEITAKYVTVNGENLVVDASSYCGSQRYSSGIALILEDAPVTCKKCNGAA